MMDLLILESKFHCQNNDGMWIVGVSRECDRKCMRIGTGALFIEGIFHCQMCKFVYLELEYSVLVPLQLLYAFPSPIFSI